MIRVLFVITLLLILNINLNSKDQYDFSLSLYNEGDYYRAISEFDRFIYYYPQSDKVYEAYLYITKSYYFAEQYQQGVEEIEKIKSKIKKDNFYYDELDFWLAKNYLFLGKISYAEKIFSNLKTKSTNNGIKEQVAFNLIWVNIFNSQWNSASQSLENYKNLYANLQLHKDIDLIKSDIAKGQNFGHLSPIAAAIMSTVLPGLGQVYDKRIGDGIVALSFISLLTYGTFYYHKNGPKELFYSFSLLDVIFYLGNIYTAYGSAIKYNRNFNTELKENMIKSYYY